MSDPHPRHCPMHLHLVVPELFWPHEDPASAHAGIATPAIELLIARGRKSVHPCASVEAWLMEAFGIDIESDAPSAPYAAMADGLDTSSGTWWHADPVHLHLGRDDFTLIDTAGHFTLARDEADALVATLNTHFAGDGLRIHAPHPDRWYLRSERADGTGDARTTPLAATRARPVNARLPDGPDARLLRRVLNETQMLCHDHPVNTAREGRGQRIANSVWIWGGGRLAEPAHIRMTSMYADTPLPTGIGRAAKLPVAGLPSTLDALLAQAGGQSASVPCAVLADLRAASSYGEQDTWQTGIAQLESSWFAPALAALRARRIGMLTLHLCGPGSELRVETTTSDLRYLWRRRRPLASYIRDTHDASRDGAAA